MFLSFIVKMFKHICCSESYNIIGLNLYLKAIYDMLNVNRLQCKSFV